MTNYDCDEYWLHTVWDRTQELKRWPRPVSDAFLQQEELLISALLETSRNRGTLSVADVGCGPGHIAASVLHTFGDRVSLTLVDLNPSTLAEARCRVGNRANTRFHVGKLQQLGEAFPGAFDVVYCIDVLHHLADIEGALRSIGDALAAGGMLIANSFARDRYSQWDFLKYGFFRSMIRRGASLLANRAYPWLSPARRRWIRTRGLGRIAPLSEADLRAALASNFDAQLQLAGYYYFLRANVRKHA